MNGQNHKKRMDFGASHHQMSPEMLEAQRRLAEKKAANPAAFRPASVPSAAPRYPAPVNSAPAGRPLRPAAPQGAAPIGDVAAPAGRLPRPTVAPPSHQPLASSPRQSSPSRHSAGPSSHPSASPSSRRPAGPLSRRPAGPSSRRFAKRPHARNAATEPSGPVPTPEMETLEFEEALNTFTSAQPLPRPIQPASGPATHPTPGSAVQPASGPAAQPKKKKKPTFTIKSPFINTANVEKRPLSGHSVNHKQNISPASPRPEPFLTPQDNIPTVVHNKRKNRKSNVILAIAIVLTVILGAVVGTFIYLAFFQ